MPALKTTGFRPIEWVHDRVRLIDQTRLPTEEVWLELSDYRDVVAAIKEMRIRGAPAIGVAGAYAVVLAAMEIVERRPDDFESSLAEAAKEIEEARPTGANLRWAVRRMLDVCRSIESAEDVVSRLVDEAEKIHREDEDANRRIGRYGAELLPGGAGVLTHCNAGALATGGFGTALGVVRTAWDEGRISTVYATETRPLFQGARLTTWELTRDGIPATLITDSAAGQLLRGGKVGAVVVGADRIAANGDVANKIGTYSIAVLARENDVHFYVAAPTSTIDMSVPSGDAIPIEERQGHEVTIVGGARIVPDGVRALNPAFDVTPSRYVTAIITEAGVARDPYDEQIRRLMESAGG